MIRSYRHKGLEKLSVSRFSRLVNPKLQKRISILLDVLNAAATLSDIDVVGARLHQLKGARRGTWSIAVSANWRITFRFENGDVYDVDLEDYH